MGKYNDIQQIIIIIRQIELQSLLQITVIKTSFLITVLWCYKLHNPQTINLGYRIKSIHRKNIVTYGFTLRPVRM